MHTVRSTIHTGTRRALLGLALALPALTLIGCNGANGAATQTGPYKGPPHTLTIRPPAFTLPVNATRELVASNGGGEAIRFFTDWTIQEGAAGGTLSKPVPNGAESTVVYTAPSTPGGPYHIIAADHVDPGRFKAVASVTVTPAGAAK